MVYGFATFRTLLNSLSFQAMDHLQAFISDCDHRTEAAKKRLAETQEELTAEVAAKANAVHAFAEEIGKKLAKAEQLGEAGEVEESIKLMGEIEELRAKKIKAEHEYRSSMPASTYQQQKLRVCEVCSAYLGIHDNDIRLADHFGGKLHLGFMVIREKLAELEVSVDGGPAKARVMRLNGNSLWIHLQKTAGPRKSELKKTGNQRGNDRKSRYFVGGRELDRRSRVHRSRSNDRTKSGGGGGDGEKRVDERKSSERRERKDSGRSDRGGRRRSRSRSRSRDRDRHNNRRQRSTSRDRDRRDRRDRDRNRR